ncbi:MAG TPA: TIM44-like domain-containing protein [Rhodocyclaceae bacterium]|nr:TIM44-like domain-containing protein [Rhodocyclaceae bacterium]HRQ46508.1 TIM44-like domain-containing protein [Rhodocyclaceae bacterium]
MKRLIISVFAAIFTLGIMIPEAEARRFGGGGSFGMQRQISPQQPPRQPAAPQQNLNRQGSQQTAAGQTAGRSWMGPVAGLAAGLGLVAFFSHLGLGEEFASFFLIALLVFGALTIYRLVGRRAAATQAANRLHYAGVGSADALTLPKAEALPRSISYRSGATDEDFNAEAFMRQAKLQFIRLQAAYDAANLDDIREFTAPEVFAEIRLQLADRGALAQHTDVVDLDAEVVELVEEPTRYVASVRFHGLIREDRDAAPIAFDEIWHLSKPRSGTSGWVIAGIQQVN